MQSAAMLIASFALLFLVGLIATLIDRSTEAEKACIANYATDFMKCIRETRK